jgi:hypothetical protein
MTNQQLGGAGSETAYGVSDEVWASVASVADQVAAGERRALRRAALTIGVLAVTATALMLSGLVTPRLSGGNNAGGGADAGGTAFIEFTLHNDGITPVRVVGWTSPLEGVRVTTAEPREVRLDPRGSVKVKVSLVATDCTTAIPAARRALEKSPLSGAGLVAVVDRPWGHLETRVNPVMSVEDMVLSTCGVDASAG